MPAVAVRTPRRRSLVAPLTACALLGGCAIAVVPHHGDLSPSGAIGLERALAQNPQPTREQVLGGLVANAQRARRLVDATTDMPVVKNYQGQMVDCMERGIGGATQASDALATYWALTGACLGQLPQQLAGAGIFSSLETQYGASQMMQIFPDDGFAGSARSDRGVRRGYLGTHLSRVAGLPATHPVRQAAAVTDDCERRALATWEAIPKMMGLPMTALGAQIPYEREFAGCLSAYGAMPEAGRQQLAATLQPLTATRTIEVAQFYLTALGETDWDSRFASAQGAPIPTVPPIGGALVAAAPGAPLPAPQSNSLLGAMFAPAPSAGLAQPQAFGAVPFTPESTAGLVAPQPILGNTGQYMSPFTEDGTVTVWVEKATAAKMGSAVGGMIGAEAGKELAKNIPFIGGMLGKQVGEKAGREIAIKAAGGWEYIKANSDLSFASARDLATWLKVTHSANPHYKSVVGAIKEIYPELKTML